ncbi:MAG: molybdopterin-dependent oxidoreductase [Symbiobacteriia bacterium]
MSEAPKAPEMVTVTVDGRTGQVPKGTLLVEAAKTLGVEIPVFCYHPKLDPAGVCRMCLVQVEKMPKPVTACTTTVSEGMVVHTDTDQVASLRKGVLEFLLLNHPLDCPVCDKGGECDLQDLTFRHGPGESRLAEPKEHKDKAVDLGPFIVLDEERCILCRRCVRFDNEVAGEQNLVIAERGHWNIVTTNDGHPYDSYFSGNTIELCPVGALTSELFRFKGRPWDLATVDAVCTSCSLHCNVKLEYRHGRLERVYSRDNPQVDGGWLCDRGRFNYTYITGDPRGPQVIAAEQVDRDPMGRSIARLQEPLVRRNGELVPVSWQEALTEAGHRLKEIRETQGGQAIGLIGGGRLTNEEAYAFQKLGRVALGTNNIDHRVAGQTVASLEGFSGRVTDLDDAQVALLVDVLPAEQVPVLDLRLRRGIERRRMKMLAVGAAMPTYRSRHARLQVKPGQTAATLEALTQAVNGQAAAGASQLKALGVNFATDVLAKAAELVAGGEKVVAVWNGGDAAVGRALAGLMKALAKGRRVKLIVAGEQSNSRGAEFMGVRPDVLPGFKPVADAAARDAAAKAWKVKKLPETAGLAMQQMLEAAAAGSIKALVLAGANLVGTYPDGGLAKQALEQVELLIVQDLFLTETAALADIVLPVAPFPMKDGSYTNLDGLVQHVARSMDVGSGAQTDLSLFDGLGALLGVNLVRSAQDLKSEMKSLMGDVHDGQVLAGAPASLLGQAGTGALGATKADTAADSLLLVAIPRLFAGGGTAWFDPGLRDVYPTAAARLNPADAARLGFQGGDQVEVSGPLGTLQLTVQLDETVQAGTLQAVSGLVEKGASRIGLSGQPVAVKLAKRAMVEVG